MSTLFKTNYFLNRKVLLFFCLLTTFFSVNAQTKWADWSFTPGTSDFDANMNYVNTLPAFVTGSTSNGITSLASSISSNITVFSGSTGGYQVPICGTVNTTTSPYFQFTLNNNATSVTFNRFVLGGIKLNVGTQAYDIELRWSNDNYASVIGTKTLPNEVNNFSLCSFPLSTTAITNSAISFRIYFKNITGYPLYINYNNTFSLNNDATTSTYTGANKVVSVWYTTATLPAPTISTSGTLAAFTKCAGSASTAQSFSVSGTNTTAGISIAALNGFEYCLTSNGTYTSTLTVGGAGTVASTPVYVRMQSTANNASYAAANIVLSAGATSTNVSASGTVSTPFPNGNALDFDGTNDNVSTVYNTAYNLTNLTVEAWVYLTANSFRYVATKYIHSSSYGGYWLMTGYNGTSNVAFGLGQGSGNWNVASSTTNITLNTWTHIAGTYDGTNIKVYINGVLSGTKSYSGGIINTPDGFLIGKRSDVSNSYFQGKIDELRVWNTAKDATALSSKMYSSLAGTETGLIGYYNFDNGTASGTNTGVNTLTNLSNTTGLNGTLNNFTLTGATSNWVASLSAGISGNSSVAVTSTTTLTTTATGGTWSSSNTNIATVNSSGVVTGVAGGNCTISYTYTSGCSIVISKSIAVISPTISTIGTLSAFTACAGSISTNQSFSVSGSNLSSNIIITPPSGYEICLTSGGTYQTTALTLTQTSGTVSSTTIFVRTTTAATGTPNGNVTLTSTGATQVNIAASATINALPTITGTLSINPGTSQLTGSGTANATTPWTSSNTSVATVSNSGLVTALTGGTSTITYLANTGCPITATFTVTTPTITSSGTLTAFSKCTGIASTAQIFSVSGVNLNAGITIAALTGFEYCLTSDGTYTSTLTVGASGTIAATDVYVRMQSTANNATYSAANIVLSSTGATNVNKSASGTVSAPTITGTLSLTSNTSQLTGSASAAVSNPWISSNTAVATISNTGLVTPLSTGTSTITYTNTLGCSINATVTVVFPIPAPTITSFSPTSGAVGTSITISGTGFSTTAANNVVYFGGVQATVTGTPTSTNLIVTVPSGSMNNRITIVVDGLTATSKTEFRYSNTALSVFTPSVSYASNLISISGGTFGGDNTIQDVIVADFDGDGKIDVAKPSSSGGFSATQYLNFYRNTHSSGQLTSSSLTFQTTVNCSSAQYSSFRQGYAVDLNNDGKLDIVMDEFYNGGIFYLINTSTSGTISFGACQKIAMNGNASFGDYDNDGKIDITGAGFGGDNKCVKNTTTSGTIGFGAVTLITNHNLNDNNFMKSRSGDIDGDGKIDILYTGGTLGFMVLRNTYSTSFGASSFANQNITTSGATVNDFVLFDADNDGDLDIISVDQANSRFLILTNNSTPGTISLSSPSYVSFGATIASGNIGYISFGDLNGDGKTDIVLPELGSNLYLFLNNSSSSISFNSPLVQPFTSTGFRGVEIADLNQDNKADFIIANNHAVVLLENVIGRPIISSFTPSSGPSSTSILITGSNFTNATSVTIGGTAVQSFTVNSSTQITAIAGNGSNGVISVTTALGSGNSSSNFSFPTLVQTSSLTPFQKCNGVASAAQIITISGTNLGTNNITIAAPTGFELATTSGGTYSSNLTYAPTSGTVANSTVYIRMTSSATSPSGDVVLSSTNANTINIAVTGITVTGVSVVSTTPNSRCGIGTVALTSSATNSGTISWFSAPTGGTALTTGTSYTTPSISTTTTYYVDATNACGTSTPRTSVIATVNALPAISVHPTTATTFLCFNGSSSNLSITATGAGLTYQWYSNTTASNSGGTLISGAISSTYVLPTSILGTTYYYCEVSGTCTPSVKSNVSGAVIITNSPTISVDPSTVGESICMNSTSSQLSVTALGSGLSYQWYFNTTASNSGGTLVSGATASTYSPQNSVLSSRYYYCVVNNVCNIAATSAISGLIEIKDRPTIASSTPNSRCGAGTVSLEATSNYGSAILNWYSVATAGTSLGTGSPFTTPSIPSSTNYYVDATLNGCTTPSRTIVAATINSTISITANPSTTNVSYCIGLAATSVTALSVTAPGTTQTYQWFSNITNVNTGGTLITGATASTYKPLTTTVGTLYYYCVVNNVCATPITSSVSGLITIEALPTISGILTKKRTETSQLTGSGTAAASIPWASSNTAIATVSSTGLVTAVAAGTCTITYKVSSGCTITATFTTTPNIIYANSVSGNDTNNGFTQSTAKKTFTAAYNTTVAGDIIDLTGTFTWGGVGETTAVTSGFTINKNITIRGQGADQTIIQANALPNVADRKVFTINTNVTVVLENLTIQHGRVANLDNSVYPADGGGIHNSGTLTLNFCRITKNTAIAGTSLSGGIGGGIYHLAINTMRINGCTFDNNEANGGGAIGNEFGNTSSNNFIITNSTFAYNKSGTGGTIWLGGGAIRFQQGTNIITNSTFAYNSIDTGVGASIQVRLGDVKLKNSIFVNGTKGGQPLPGGSHEITVSQGSATDEGNNIFGTTTGFTFNATSWQPSSGGGYQNVGDNTKKCILNVETVLGSNGATNGTVSLKTTGLNIEEGSTVANNGISIPTIDQRGLTRVGTPDIGAYEYTDIEPFVTCFSPSTGAAGTSVAIKGINLTGASSVKFNSVEATSYTVNSGVSITAIAPQSTTGLISVTTNLATANSSSNYTYPPLIERTGTLTAFTKCSGSPSAAQSFTVSGSNMTAAISIAALTGFEYCLTVGGTYTTTLTVGAAGTIASTPVFVRMQSTANSASYAANNIVLSSSGATSVNVSASGTVNTTATISTQPSTSAATYCSSATAVALSVTAGSTVNLTYQWYSKTTSGNTGGTLIGGANSNTYIPSTSTAGVLYYYCVITNPCGSLSSNASGAITVNSSVGGSISGSATVCSGTNSTILTLSGHTGSITRWESSLDNFATAGTTIINTTTTFTATNLNTTTSYRAVVTNGSCTADNSASATLTVTNDNTWLGTTSPAWITNTNWSCGSVPTATTNVIIASSSNQPIIDSNVSINSLTINTGTTVTVNSGFNLTVTNAVANSGTMTLQNNANLLQDTAATTNSNTGSITVKRDSASLLRLDHTLWSSPVASQNLFGFSPATLTNRFYIYDTAANVFSTTGLSASTTFAAGKGYAVRAPNNHSSTTPTTWTGTFTGVPNNGTVPFTLVNGVNNYNLVGNPYPSPISASAFLTANSSLINGTFYFYAHSLTMNADGSFPSGTNYCSWNGSAVTVATTAAAGDFHPIPVTPNGIIQVGQGFFVKATAPGTINFTNAMRVGNNANQFFRTTEIERHRLWLNLTTENDTDINQIAVAYVEGATQGADSNFDGLSFGNTGSMLSSKIDAADYVIQGRSLPFDSNDVVSLGFKAATARNYKITLTNKDGLFLGNQDVFVRDNLMGIEHNIKMAPYLFASQAGTFDGRFQLVYTQALGTPSSLFTPNSVLATKNSDGIHVTTNGIVMKDIFVYDISGRLLFKQTNINGTTTVLKGLSQTKQVLLLKITSQENETVTVKVIN